MDELTLEIRDFGSIDEAKINLKKINIIGGINGSGKSTASKLLYCFLNAMSSNRKEYLLENILSNVNSILAKEDNLSNNKKSSPNDLTIDDDFKTSERGYLLAKKVFNRLTFNDDGIEEIIQETDKLIPILKMTIIVHTPRLLNLYLKMSL